MSQNFNTYVLKGTGNGDTNAISSILANIGCNASETNQNKSCEVIVNNPNSVTKITCKNKDDSSTCTYTPYRSDSSQDICYGQRAQLVNSECVATMKGSYEKEYDENGNMTEHLCNNYTTGSGCYALGEEVYDAGGKHLAAANRYCDQWNEYGQCIAYQQGKGNDHLGIFDGNHKFWVRGDCQEIDIDGNCLSYKGGRVEE